MDDRNRKWVDAWSVTHLAWGLVLGFFLHPLLAFALLAVYEPIEIFVLSPLLARVGVRFGREGWQNSVGDLAIDAVAVALGFWARRLVG